MKKFLVFALIALVAGMASAQSVSWIGNSVVYHVQGDTWYNCSGNWGSSAFDTADFGLVSALTLGGQASTWWTDSGSHQAATDVNMNYQVDALTADYVDLNWLDYGSNNDRWENMTGENVIATSGVGAGEHTVAVWFSATDGVTTVYDSNSSANYIADFETAIPEPATMSLLGLGALAMVLRRKMSK